MKTPAYKPFIDSVGKTVHHLNTIAVGLSGVESGNCTQPEELNISWTPSNIKHSSRDARQFTLKATIVFVAEELNSYNSLIINSANIGNITLPKDADRSQKHLALTDHFEINDPILQLGPLLLIHWRNRIIHKKSTAKLTSSQISILKNSNAEIKDKYKNLCTTKLLQDFEKGLPTLKDVSSLIAMTINYVHAVEKLIPEPKSINDLESWLKNLGLYSQYERAQRVSISKPNPLGYMTNFFNTQCPQLLKVYKSFY
ncbi:conserved hypothetical protein [Acinetobacter sp. 8I-beige]|uniref:hypothetical protein n=1 Tax=Acinetobacter sp. 8I-beige TaxID=2653125 RepID=UPI0012F07406|nr:hypothetical protein [Acinetobacter sp. 8I-beige]VXA84854.1 conserved hypothetical protein [Acinetobacter sp. 8I-beige]